MSSAIQVSDNKSINRDVVWCLQKILMSAGTDAHYGILHNLRGCNFVYIFFCLGNYELIQLFSEFKDLNIIPCITKVCLLWRLQSCVIFIIVNSSNKL